jgi:hypothetical protein
MSNSLLTNETNIFVTLKVDALSRWIESEWVAARPDANLHTIWTTETAVNRHVLEKFKPDFELPDQYRFAGYKPYPQTIIPHVFMESSGETITYQSGVFIYRFEHTDGGDPVEVFLGAIFTSDDYYDEELVCLACMPVSFEGVWHAFIKECKRIDRSLKPRQEVHIIGGWDTSFTPDTNWEDIVLPPELKDGILDDFESFFDKGIHVYKRLNLKPFRKLLFAGVPGTGKTMLCSALAKRALEQEYLVVYISSADEDGATFRKIQRAIDVASRSEYPALIILEELDAYLHNEEKALVLNVLDGSEGSINEHGTLLIATTNYPEAIDERVLKRPGRLDRIFIVPEMRRQEDAEKMLKLYLTSMWQDEHRVIAEKLVGYPGAFVREVAIYALTQVARDDLPELSLEMLENSFNSLSDQINMRDDFLIRRGTMGYSNGNSRKR